MQGILSTKEYDTKNNQIRKNNVKLDLGKKKNKHTKTHSKQPKRKKPRAEDNRFATSTDNLDDMERNSKVYGKKNIKKAR
jgi:hypothetical protein